jgi:hypothetical protein
MVNKQELPFLVFNKFRKNLSIEITITIEIVIASHHSVTAIKI